MFENLTEKLQRVFKDLRGEGKLTEQNIQDALKEIRLALLEADVNFKVVKQLVENIRHKALGQEVLTAFSPTEQVVKIVKDELIRILGSTESKLRYANTPPSVYLIVGLQGSGKTTSTGKLALWLSKNGHQPADGFGRRLPAGGARAIAGGREPDQPADLPRQGFRKDAAGACQGRPARSHRDRPRRGAGRYRRPAAHR